MEKLGKFNFPNFPAAKSGKLMASPNFSRLTIPAEEVDITTEMARSSIVPSSDASDDLSWGRDSNFALAVVCFSGLPDQRIGKVSDEFLDTGVSPDCLIPKVGSATVFFRTLLELVRGDSEVPEPVESTSDVVKYFGFEIWCVLEDELDFGDSSSDRRCDGISLVEFKVTTSFGELV